MGTDKLKNNKKKEEYGKLKLKEALAKIPADEIVGIGAHSNYFYFGKPGDFSENKCLIKHIRGCGSDTTPMMEREVVQSYRQDGADYVTIFLVQGPEAGLCWTKNEYEAMCGKDDQWKRPVYTEPKEEKKYLPVTVKAMTKCPICGSYQTNKSGKTKGFQNYYCYNCQTNFFEEDYYRSPSRYLPRKVPVPNIPEYISLVKGRRQTKVILDIQEDPENRSETDYSPDKIIGHVIPSEPEWMVTTACYEKHSKYLMLLKKEYLTKKLAQSIQKKQRVSEIRG